MENSNMICYENDVPKKKNEIALLLIADEREREI
jgi:hypothetical protein